MLGLLSCALKRVIIELCQEKSSNHEKHGWNFYAKVVFLQPRLLCFEYSMACGGTQGTIVKKGHLKSQAPSCIIYLER